MQALIKKILLLALFLLCTSCVRMVIPPSSSSFVYQAPSLRLSRLDDIQVWDITGAISIKTQNKANIASFLWVQNDGSYTIRLSSSLNLVSFTVIGKPGEVSLVKGRAIYQASTPEDLLRTRVNVQLPVSYLRYWVLSIPAPQKPYEAKYDDYGHLILLQQAGWQVQFSQFTSLGGVDLPQKILLDNGAINVRMVIKQWQLN